MLEKSFHYIYCQKKCQEVMFCMKKFFTLSISVALLCFTSNAFSGRSSDTLNLTDHEISEIQNRQQRLGALLPPQAAAHDEPENDNRNFNMHVGATLAKSLIHQGCYIVSLFSDELNIERAYILSFGVMISVAHATYNFDESKRLFGQDLFSACLGVMLGRLAGGFIGISMNLPIEEQNEVATYLAMTGGMIANFINFTQQMSHMFKRKFIFF